MRADQGRNVILYALLLLALLLRVGWAMVAGTELWFDHIFTDATAMGLLEGRGFTVSLEPPYDPAIFRTPGYSFFLAGIYGVAGHSAYPEVGSSAIHPLVGALSRLLARDWPVDPVLGETTLNVGLVSGGSIELIVKIAGGAIFVVSQSSTVTIRQ